MLQMCTAWYTGYTNCKMCVHFSAIHKYTVVLKSCNYNTNKILQLPKIYKM